VHVLAITTPHALKLVEYTVVLIEITELSTEMIVDGNRLDGPRLHVDVPDLERQVVP
jgi:hypothetical protein